MSDPSTTAKAERLISLVLPDLGMGGAERVFLTLAEGFARRDFEVHLVITRKAGALLTEVPQGVILVDLAAGGEAGALFKLVRYLRTHRPQAVLSTLDLMSSVVIVARWLSGISTCVLVREANTPSQMPRAGWKKPIERLILRRLFPGADILVAVSCGVAQDLSMYAGIQPSRITTIYNPVLPDDLDARLKLPVAHPWFEPGQPPVILGMGSLVERKNFPLLIRAFARLADETDARLVIFGEGEQREALQAQVDAMGLSERVSLPGLTAHPFSTMAQADVFVLSSNLEGLPNVLIQALASGCPVVSSDCPSGPREILADGKYGALVPVGDEDALAHAIRRAVTGEKPAVDDAWLDQFRVERVVEQYLKILDLK